MSIPSKFPLTTSLSRGQNYPLSSLFMSKMLFPLIPDFSSLPSLVEDALDPIDGPLVGAIGAVAAGRRGVIAIRAVGRVGRRGGTGAGAGVVAVGAIPTGRGRVVTVRAVLAGRLVLGLGDGGCEAGDHEGGSEQDGGLHCVVCV